MSTYCCAVLKIQNLECFGWSDPEIVPVNTMKSAKFAASSNLDRFIVSNSTSSNESAISYIFDGSDWIQTEVPNSSNARKLILSKNGLVVAVIFWDHLNIYGYNETTWREMGKNIPIHRGYFPVALSGDGSTLVVGMGESGQDTNVTIYSFDGSDYVVEGVLESDDETENFGNSIAISSDGSRIAVGSTYRNENDLDCLFLFRVRIYDRNEGQWVNQQIVTKDKCSYRDIDMSHNGNRIIVDSKTKAEGFARVYDYDGRKWIQKGRGLRGTLMAISGSGDFVAMEESSRTFKIYEYKKVPNTWIQVGKVFKSECYLYEMVVLSYDGSRVLNAIFDQIEIHELKNGVNCKKCSFIGNWIETWIPFFDQCSDDDYFE